MLVSVAGHLDILTERLIIDGAVRLVDILRRGKISGSQHNTPKGEGVILEFIVGVLPLGDHLTPNSRRAVLLHLRPVGEEVGIHASPLNQPINHHEPSLRLHHKQVRSEVAMVKVVILEVTKTVYPVVGQLNDFSVVEVLILLFFGMNQPSQVPRSVVVARLQPVEGGTELGGNSDSPVHHLDKVGVFKPEPPLSSRNFKSNLPLGVEGFFLHHN